MIEEDAEIIWESSQWVVLRIATRSCWVVLPRDDFKVALELGKAWKRHVSLQARLKADDARRGKD